MQQEVSPRRFTWGLTLYTHILASRYTRRTESMPSPTLEPCTQPRMTDSLITKQQHGQHERRRNFQLYISLIVEHATRCDSLSCQSSHCQKMKFYLKHGLACTVNASGGCFLCKRITTLLRIHAQQCKTDTAALYVPQRITLSNCILHLLQNK